MTLTSISAKQSGSVSLSSHPRGSDRLPWTVVMKSITLAACFSRTSLTISRGYTLAPSIVPRRVPRTDDFMPFVGEH